MFQEFDRRLGVIQLAHPDIIATAALHSGGHEIGRHRYATLDDVETGHRGDGAEAELATSQHLNDSLRGIAAIDKEAGLDQNLTKLAQCHVILDRDCCCSHVSSSRVGG